MSQGAFAQTSLSWTRRSFPRSRFPGWGTLGLNLTMQSLSSACFSWLRKEVSTSKSFLAWDLFKLTVLDSTSPAWIPLSGDAPQQVEQNLRADGAQGAQTRACERAPCLSTLIWPGVGAQGRTPIPFFAWLERRRLP